MKDDLEMDKALTEVGARWRSTVPVMVPPSPSSFRQPRTASRLSALSAVLVLTACIGALLISLPRAAPGTQTGSTASPASTATPSNSEPEPARVDIVSPGDAVVAAGWVVQWSGIAMSLCPDLHFLGTNPACDPDRLVRLTGIPNFESLPGASREGNSQVTDHVDVTGTWTGDSLSVEHVSASMEGPGQTPQLVPCQEPEGGWPGSPPPELAEEAWLRLRHEINDHPTLYVGPWWAVFNPALGADSEGAQVVGTVGDVSAAITALQSAYRYNTCVVEVAFSTADLNGTRDLLSSRGLLARMDVDAASDRLAIRPIVLDANVAAMVQDQRDRITVEPVVLKVH